MSKFDPDKFTPTGRYAYVLDSEDDECADVADYSVTQITDYVHPTMIGDRDVAHKFADQLYDGMAEWNADTDVEATWGELVNTALEIFKEKIFPPSE